MLMFCWLTAGMEKFLVESVIDIENKFTPSRYSKESYVMKIEKW